MTWAVAVTLVAGLLLLGRAPVRVDRRRPLARPDAPAGPRLSHPGAWWASSGLLALMLLVWLPPGPWWLVAVAAVALVGMIGPPVLVRIERRRGRGAAPGADVALAADLVAASLAAGVPLMGAVRATGEAVGGTVGALLLEASHRHAVGADPTSAVAGLSTGVSTARLGRALLRATESGMSPVHVLQAAAEAERGRRRSHRVSRARAAGSLAALPLGLFFLPAFVLVAVVPVVVGSLATVLTLG